MKRILMIFGACAAVAAGLSSCEEPETGYEGVNYIYLQSESSEMYDDQTIPVTVMLTTALDQDLTLTFEVNDSENIITLEGNPVTIAAGQTTGQFTISSATLIDLTKNFTITLSSDTVLPENVSWRENFNFTVRTSLVYENLTEKQAAIVRAYEAATGIDLTKYMGRVSVSTVYTASSQDSEVALPPVTITGYTEISLSEESTAEQPVLKMTNNPMGMQESFYDELKINTLNNPYWSEEYAADVPSYTKLLSTIGWTSTSEETFTASLDGIKPMTDGSVEFVADLSYYDEEWEENVTLFKVPFEFSFSAYERELAEIAAGTIGEDADPDWLWDATVAPDFYINCEDISEDWYEYGNWTAASATITAESMVFTFCIYNYNEYDYSKVVATYTPNE